MVKTATFLAFAVTLFLQGGYGIAMMQHIDQSKPKKDRLDYLMDPTLLTEKGRELRKKWWFFFRLFLVCLVNSLAVHYFAPGPI